MSRTQQKRFDLTGASQDSYAGQNAQDPRTSRKVQSWIIQDDGQLHRELPEPLYASGAVSGPVVGLYEFDQNDGHGNITRNYFCAARVNSTVGTLQCNFYTLVTGAWSQVSAVGTLADAPMCVTQENNFFLDDGISNWLFDGTEWVQNGINFPLNQPAINISAGSPQVLISSASNSGAHIPNGGVSVYLYAASAFDGTVSMVNGTTLTVQASTHNNTNPSLLFNWSPPNSGIDSATGPMTWSTVSTVNGSYTGYSTLPYPSGTQAFQMAVTAQLVFPVAGVYTLVLTHDDGAFFGFGPGIATAGSVTYLSGAAQNPGGYRFQPGTYLNLYPIIGGKSYQYFNQETFQVSVSEPDTYPLEINFCQFEGQCCLALTAILTNLNGAYANLVPYQTTSANTSEINAALGRYYWFDNADLTPGVATESSTSPIGVISGPLIGGSVQVYQQPGLFTCSTAHTTVTVSSSTDSPGPISPQLNGSMLGQTVYINGSEIGVIAGVGSATTLTLTQSSGVDVVTLPNGTVQDQVTYTYSYIPSTNAGGAYAPPGLNSALVGTTWTVTGFSNAGNNLTNGLVVASNANSITIVNASGVAETHAATATSSPTTFTLTTNAAYTISPPGRAVITDSRCTHWNIYASESDGSKVGEFLFSVPVGQDLATTPFVDTSPFLDSVGNSFLPIYRPVRNDRPVASKLLTVHKVRQWRRVESDPALFAFTANEEVTSGNNGDPAQCLPGSNALTVSDMVNEVSYPDQSVKLRGLVSHMDALYMFSEKQCYPLYGQSVDDFAIGQMVTFNVGLAGRFAGLSTPNGLAFMSYDKRAFLYPTSLYSTYLAQGGAAQSALSEIGKPMRNVFAQIASSRLDEVVTCHYHYGIRDWWVVSFPTSATQDLPQTWVYDFMGKSWFQLQRGFSSLNVMEVSYGNLVLIGGGVDGNTYVIDDQTGTYAPTGNLPVATWQPALINFGDDENAHVVRRLELEFDSQALAKDITVTCWLDPANVDNPGVGRTMELKPALGSYRYSASLTNEGGAVCQRALFQIQARASTNAGVIRGVKLYADTITGFIAGGNVAGGA